MTREYPKPVQGVQEEPPTIETEGYEPTGPNCPTCFTPLHKIEEQTPKLAEVIDLLDEMLERQSVSELLERLRERHEDDKRVLGMAVAIIGPNGTMDCCWSDGANASRLSGAVALLQHRILTRLDAETVPLGAA